MERGGHEAEFLVTPEKTASGYRLGILVRDHIAGIGTVTYYDPVSLQYGALGHGVSGLDGTQLLMLQSGYLVRASVAEVQTGTRGTPGELHGIFDVTDAVGTVEKNTAVANRTVKWDVTVTVSWKYGTTYLPSLREMERVVTPNFPRRTLIQVWDLSVLLL